VAEPLTAQTGKNNVLVWTDKCEVAFQKIKTLLTEAPVLALPDPDKTYTIESDASIVGIGAVLLQDGKPLAYESRKLIPAERNYTTTEQELLAVVHALKTWRCYLEGAKHPFVVRTDHNPLTFLPTQPELSRRQARWSEYLQRFHFTWEYKPGKVNMAADALSRCPAERANTNVRVAGPLAMPGTLMALPRVTGHPDQQMRDGDYKVLSPWRSQIRAGYFQDPAFSADNLKRHVEKYKLHSVDGFYWHGKHIYVPAVGNLREQIIDAFHTPQTAGHFGANSTSQAVTEHYWWPRITVDVRDFVSRCTACQMNKAHNAKPHGLLQPMPIPNGAWDSVSADWISGLPRTASGHNSILVVVDRLTKMAHFIPTRTEATAIETAKLFYERVWCVHGVSLDLVSDRDKLFTSAVWRRLCELWPMTQSMSTGFHPQTDGQTERVNRKLEEILRNYVTPDMSNWDELLAPVEFAYNNARSSSTGYSPFFLNYGRQPRVPASAIVLERGNGYKAEVPTVENFVGHMEKLLSRAKECILAAQQRQKFYADRGRTPVQFKQGDRVLLATKNLRLKTEGVRKLLPKYLGPLEVVATYAPRPDAPVTACRLGMPPELKVHPVFHVSLLHHYRDGGTVQPPPWQHIAPDLHAEVEKVLAHRENLRGSTIQHEYLVQWQGSSATEAEWVPESRMTRVLTAEYWRSRAARAADDPDQEPPTVVSLRRSLRLRGEDPDSDIPAPASAQQGARADGDSSVRDVVAQLGLIIPSERYSRLSLIFPP
jgi:hypothetical protein